MGARRYGISLRVFNLTLYLTSERCAANEWDIKLNTRREIPYLQACLFNKYSINRLLLCDKTRRVFEYTREM